MNDVRASRLPASKLRLKDALLHASEPGKAQVHTWCYKQLDRRTFSTLPTQASCIWPFKSRSSRFHLAHNALRGPRLPRPSNCHRCPSLALSQCYCSRLSFRGAKLTASKMTPMFFAKEYGRAVGMDSSPKPRSSRTRLRIECSGFILQAATMSVEGFDGYASGMQLRLL